MSARGAAQDPLDEREPLDEGGGLPQFLRDPLGLLWRRWRWMLLVAALGCGATVAYVATLEPKYVAKATVLVSSQKISEAFVRSTVDSQEFEKINAIVGEVLSRKNLSALVEEHGLYGGAETPLSMEERVALMRENLSIAPDEGVGQPSRGETARIYAIEFRAEEPEQAAAVANDLAGDFTAAHLRMRSQQASLTTAFLRRELERTERELRRVEGQITEFKERHRGELPGELDTNLARLDRLQQQRQSLALQIAEAESRLAMLASNPEELDPASPQGRLQALRARLEQELAHQTQEHPNVVSLRRQIEALESQLETSEGGGAPSRPTLAAAAQRTLQELRSQLSQTEAEIAKLEERVARTPARQEELAALEQRAAVLRESYLEFLRKVNQAELAESLESAQQGERVTILDRALPPRAPESAAFKLLVLGIGASLGLAAALGVLLEMLDSVLVRPDQIEDEFGIPVLGSISRIS